MPEPHHRCAECTQTLAAHLDPEVRTCSAFKVPSFGGAFDELAASCRTVGSDHGKPIQIVHYADARRCAALAHEAGKAEGRAVVVGEMELTVQNWGAFDFELLLLAEEYGVDQTLSPLEMVRALMQAARRIERMIPPRKGITPVHPEITVSEGEGR